MKSNLFRNRAYLKSRLIILGMYPPPHAGIGIYLQRLLPVLDSHNIDYHLINHGTTSGARITPTNRTHLWWFAFFFNLLMNRRKIKKRKTLLHFHIISYLQYFLIWAISFLITKRIMVTIHNQNSLRYSKIKYMVWVYLMKTMKVLKISSVSTLIVDKLTENGIEAAFVSPFIKAEPTQIKAIERNEGDWLVGVSIGGYDDFFIKRYGLDILIRALQQYQRVQLYVFVSLSEVDFDKNLLSQYTVNHGLLDRIHLIGGEVLLNYMHNFDLFVRPNREDGYGISIQEAISMGIPAIASDVCRRPSGTILFQNDKVDDLYSKIESVLGSRSRIIPENHEEDGKTKILNYYKTFLYE